MRPAKGAFFIAGTHVPRLFYIGSSRVPIQYRHHAPWLASDKKRMKQALQSILDASEDDRPIWELQIWASSHFEPVRLVQTLTGAILACGGWVLSRGSSDSGRVHMAFEFERHACEDIYSLLVGAGLNISQGGHYHLTELCQCTRMSNYIFGRDVVRVDLEIEAAASQLQKCEPSNCF